MNLVIRRMSPELAEDYFDFFDNRAFSDNSPYYPCYCNAFQMTEKQIRTEFFEQVGKNGGGEEGWRISIRKSAERMVAENVIQGYLAYDNQISIGCFEIAPSYRGKGIATALLNRVCSDAAADGYDKVEVYPVVRDAYEPLDFTGPIQLYEKAGFVRVAGQGKILVMQKDLK